MSAFAIALSPIFDECPAANANVGFAKCKSVAATTPISVEYSITPYGNTFKEFIQIMAEWGSKHRKQIIGK